MSSGISASSDFIATSDNGTDSTKYIDLGINSSGFTNSGWTISGANDGYLYVNSGNLTLGTDTSGKTVAIHVGGTLASNIAATFNAGGTASSSTSTGAVVVNGGIGVSGAVYASSFSGSGSNLTSLTAGNLSGTIPSAVLGTSTHYIGTTAIALNRSSASQTLTGVSIDGNAATATSADLLDGQHGSYYAPLASPTFTGVPTAPTASSGTNTTQVATTAFVENRGIAAEDMAIAFAIAL